MEAVKAFNFELSSLYEVKPPISKAKMTALTRGAIKAIKFYKHVVQSVEKFILKCKPEYKVPGLYVIDSIVRQSRHQFGPEKDVFAPRFSKNLQQTFVNLFKCPPEDKSKIIRVLNLWQKNQVFSPEAIQPLFDLADPNNPIHQQITQLQLQSTPVQQTNGSQMQVIKGSPALQRTPTKANNQSATSEAAAPNLNLTDPVIQQLQQLQRLLTKGADAVSVRTEQVHFDKKLLDFDYDEDEEEVNPSPRPPPPPPSAPVSTDPVASLLTNPEVLRQLQTLQNTLAGAVNPPSQEGESERFRKLQEMKMQEDEFDKHLAQTVPNLPFASECEFKLTQTPSMIGGFQFIPPQPEPLQMPPSFDLQLDNSALFGGQNNANDMEVINLDHEDSHSDDDERYKRNRSRSRSRDRGREKDVRRRRSRSRSKSRGRRNRSKSKDRKEKDKRDKEKETERDKERKKRGLPAFKKDNLSVCSTTLWVGHLSKLVHQDDLSNTFGEFGDIVSIDLIIPRGCAFIVMHRRQDAARCLAKLKNHNLHGKAITLAWAPGKGVKGKDLKDYWEGDLGVSYIPFSKLKEDMDLEALEDGGMIDEETMPEWMRKKMEQTIKRAAAEQPPFLTGASEASNHSTVDTSQPPPLPPSNMMQPPMLPPMVNPFQLNNRFLSMIPNLANLPLGVPPPNMPPSMMSNLGLGLGSPFQGPPSFMPPALPPPQQHEPKPNPPSSTDAKLRNLSESLMNLAGQPLTMPPQPLMSQPPPPLHNVMEDSMDVEMEDAVLAHPDMNKPPPNLPLSEQLQASLNSLPFNRDSRRDELRFSPNRLGRDNRDSRRDDRSNERGRRRSRSRDRDQNRDRDRNDRSGGRERDRRERDRDNRDRDFGRGGRGRDRDRDMRRGGPDRDRGNRWGPPDRREDRGERRDGQFDRRGGGPAGGRRDGNDRRDDSFERRDDSYDRRDGPGGRRDGPERREVDSRDKGEREKTLNERLKEMAGMNFDEPGQGDNNRSSPRNTKENIAKDGSAPYQQPSNEESFTNMPPLGISDSHRSPREARNPSPPTECSNQAEIKEDVSVPPPEKFDPHIKPPTDDEGLLKFIDPAANRDEMASAQEEVSKQGEEGRFGGNQEFASGPFGFDAPGPDFDGGRPDFSGPRPDFSGPRADFDRPRSGFDGSRVDFEGPRPDFEGPRPDFDGARMGFDGPRPDFVGPRPDFDGSRPDFDGPSGFDGRRPDFEGPISDFDGFRPEFDGPRPDFDGPRSDFHADFDGPGPFGAGPFRPRFRDQGLPFSDDGYGPPPDLMLEGPPNFGPPGFDGPPERFMRGGRRGRGRGRGRGNRDGPDFFARDDFGPPPLMDDFGPPPLMDDDFGPPPMRGDDFGPRGIRMRGRGFFGRGGPRGRGGGPPFGKFNPEFDGGPLPPPDFFRGGPRGRPFGDPFHRGGRRGGGGGFRGGRGRPDFFDGPPPLEFFDGPPHFEGGHPFEGPPGFDGGLPGDMSPDFDGRRGGRGRKRGGGRSSRWGGEEFDDGPLEGAGGGDGGATPLRDEIDDCGPQMDFAPSQEGLNSGGELMGGEGQGQAIEAPPAEN